MMTKAFLILEDGIKAKESYQPAMEYVQSAKR